MSESEQGGVPAGFPTAGYERVLARLIYLAHPRPGMAVLDYGCGTGELAGRLAAKGCEVCGVDPAARMLARARGRQLGLRFVQADLRRGVPAGLPQQYDRIVSAYALHGLDLADKIELLLALAEKHLAPHGRLLVAGISFPDGSARSQARREWGDRWPQGEHYWAADETLMALEASGLSAGYEQITPTDGIYIMPER